MKEEIKRYIDTNESDISQFGGCSKNSTQREVYGIIISLPQVTSQVFK